MLPAPVLCQWSDVYRAIGRDILRIFRGYYQRHQQRLLCQITAENAKRWQNCRCKRIEPAAIGQVSAIRLYVCRCTRPSGHAGVVCNKESAERVYVRSCREAVRKTPLVRREISLIEGLLLALWH